MDGCPGGRAGCRTGKPTTYQGDTLTFNPQNQLTAYAGLTGTIAYTGGGLRAWVGSTGNRRYFLYTGETLLAEIAEDDEVVLATHTWGADGLISRTDAAAEEGDARPNSTGQARYARLPRSPVIPEN